MALGLATITQPARTGCRGPHAVCSL